MRNGATFRRVIQIFVLISVEGRTLPIPKTRSLRRKRVIAAYSLSSFVHSIILTLFFFRNFLPDHVVDIGNFDSDLSWSDVVPWSPFVSHKSSRHISTSPMFFNQ